MSNDRVPLENIESPYGGGASSLPGATGDLLLVMFPVAPVLLTYPKQSALGVSLDSGLMEGMSRPEPLEQSVLGALSVVRPDETDTPERPALASQMNHEQSRFKSSARPMLDTDKVDNTDVNADVNTDLPENSAQMMNLDLRFCQSDAQLCPPVADTLDRRPMEGISDRLLVNSPGLALAPDSDICDISEPV